MKNQSLKDKTAKGLFWGGVSNGLQQAIGVVFGIFFARLLNSEEYGLVGTLAIFTALAGILQDSGFSAALVNKKEFKHEDYNAVFWFSIIVGIVVYVILFFCAPLIALFFDTPELEAVSRVMFLWFLVGGIGIAHNAILTKRIMMKEKAKASLVALVVSNAIGLILAIKGYSYWAIVIQTVIYGLVATVLICYYSPWRPTLKINFSPLKEMIPFSSKVLATGIFNVANANIFTVLLGRFYTLGQLGDYSQANKWTGMGSTFINSVLTSVAHPVLAEVSDDINRQRNVFRKMIRFTSFISFPSLLGLAFVSREFIVIMVTEKWLTCVPIMQLLCIWAAFIPINSLYSYLFISRGKSDINMWNIILVGVIQLLVAFLVLPYGVLNMVTAFVSVNIFWLFVIHFLAYRIIRYRLRDVLKDILPFIFITCVVIGVAYLLTCSVTNIYLLFGLKITIPIILYVLIMRLSNAKVFMESVNYLLKKKN